MRQYLLRNVALPFTSVIALVLFGFLLEYLHGERLGQFINDLFGFLAFLSLMMAALIVLLVKKRFLFAVSSVACLAGIVMLARSYGRLPDFYLLGLRNGIQHRVDLDKVREWTFAQPLPDHGFQAFLDRDIPEEMRRGFRCNKDMLVTVRSTKDGGRELLVGSTGILFGEATAPIPPYMDLGNHASVFVDKRQ